MLVVVIAERVTCTDEYLERWKKKKKESSAWKSEDIYAPQSRKRVCCGQMTTTEVNASAKWDVR